MNTYVRYTGTETGFRNGCRRKWFTPVASSSRRYASGCLNCAYVRAKLGASWSALDSARVKLLTCVAFPPLQLLMCPRVLFCCLDVCTTLWRDWITRNRIQRQWLVNVLQRMWRVSWAGARTRQVYTFPLQLLKRKLENELQQERYWKNEGKGSCVKVLCWKKSLLTHQIFMSLHSRNFLCA